MRAVIQRVTSASVTVDGTCVSSIGKGLLCLVGVGVGDTAADAVWLANKILNLKLWADESGKHWKHSVKQIDGEIILVSQFTLYALTTKGTKPDFHRAMGGDEARIAFDAFVELVRKEYVADRVGTGVFGAMMDVQLVNDGPVTITLDSVDKPQPPVKGTKQKLPAVAAGDTSAAAADTAAGAPAAPQAQADSDSKTEP